MNPKTINFLVKFVGIGWYIAICIGLGALLGTWADDKLSLSPLLTILGVLVGILTAFLGMYRMLNNVLNSSEK
jgi:F0F1-type ATP synthase assembly protein I|tara:strand:+ start:2767 stop:2985 length:219 start_codon:yes stop_codon:yes gene_type:complete